MGACGFGRCVAGWVCLGLAGIAAGQEAGAKAGAQGTPVEIVGDPAPLDWHAAENPATTALGGPGDRIAPSTPLGVRLNGAVSSGAAQNGDLLQGVLVGPVRTVRGAVLAAGTPVTVAVMSSSKAGRIASAGVLTLEVVKVGRLAVASDVLEFSGQEGRREVADANPEKGTEAMIAAGTELRFRELGDGGGLEPGGAGIVVAPSGASVLPGQGTVGAPGSFAAPAAGSAPATAIHGVTTPH